MNRCVLLACMAGVSLLAAGRAGACDVVSVGALSQTCVAASVEAPVAVAPQVFVSPLVAVAPSVAVVPTVVSTQFVGVNVRPVAVRVRVAPRVIGAGSLRRCRF